MTGFVEGVPTVTIELGGSRTLGFTLGAVRRIQEKQGSLDVSPETMLTALPTYVWACMSANDRAQLAVEDVEEMLHLGNMQSISKSIGQLFLASQPEGAEGNAIPVPPKVRRAASR